MYTVFVYIYIRYVLTMTSYFIHRPTIQYTLPLHCPDT